jgi:hypothetical protein
LLNWVEWLILNCNLLSFYLLLVFGIFCLFYSYFDCCFFAVNSEANARRITLVESCFGSAGQPLSVPGRVLVGEGVLTKMCRKKPKPRQFYLFNDLLVYGNIIINKKKYNKQHIIPLEEVRSNLLTYFFNFY